MDDEQQSSGTYTEQDEPRNQDISQNKAEKENTPTHCMNSDRENNVKDQNELTLKCAPSTDVHSVEASSGSSLFSIVTGKPEKGSVSSVAPLEDRKTDNSHSDQVGSLDSYSYSGSSGMPATVAAISDVSLEIPDSSCSHESLTEVGDSSVSYTEEASVTASHDTDMGGICKDSVSQNSTIQEENSHVSPVSPAQELCNTHPNVSSGEGMLEDRSAILDTSKVEELDNSISHSCLAEKADKLDSNSAKTELHSTVLPIPGTMVQRDSSVSDAPKTDTIRSISHSLTLEVKSPVNETLTAEDSSISCQPITEVVHSDASCSVSSDAKTPVSQSSTVEEAKVVLHNNIEQPESSEKESVVASQLDVSVCQPSTEGETEAADMKESDLNKHNETVADDLQSFSNLLQDAETELGAARMNVDEECQSSPSTNARDSTEEMEDMDSHSLDKAVTSLDTNCRSGDVETTQPVEKLKTSSVPLKEEDTQGQNEVENIQSNVSLSEHISSNSEEGDTIESCALNESRSQYASENNPADENSETNSEPNIGIDETKQIHNDAAITEMKDDAINSETVDSKPSLSSASDGQEVVEHGSQNSASSTLDNSQTSLDDLQDNAAEKNADILPKTDSVDKPFNFPSNSNNTSVSNAQCDGGVSFGSKKLHSPAGLSVVESESNSWDNSYTLDGEIPPGKPMSAGSTQLPEASLTRTFGDTESSNLSFASASTSTTQPLDMGDIIKAGMDMDATRLPEATSNVGVGGNIQMSVDEWCMQQASTNKQITDEASKSNASLNADSAAVGCDEVEFDWEEYMEDTKSSPAPDAAFPHVEASLRSNFEKGMKFEVAHSSVNKYWIATVVMPCGQLLRLRYDGCEGDSSKDFWCDAFTSDIHPLGWCRQNDRTLEPPDDLKERFPDWHNYVQTTLDQATTASDKLLGGVLGTAAVDQIKQSMLVEVQHENDLARVWIARVLENIGGRLLLRYEGTDSARQDFWLFYLHYRIHPMGWAEEMGMSYGPPEAVAEEWSCNEGWKAILEKAQNDAKTLPFPADVLADQEVVLDHEFKEGWKLEALHPVTKNQICPATVVQVFNSTYFLVQLDDLQPSLDDPPIQMCCHGGSRNIFPIKWAEKQGLHLGSPNGWQKEFDWQNYLTEMQSEPAPPEVFNLECDEVKLAKGMKLEASNPEQPGHICVATVMQVTEHLVFIHLESSAELNSFHMVDYQSQEIFPVGWCESNNYPLKPPNRAFFTRRQKKKSIEPTPAAPQKTASSSHSKSRHGDKGGIWCPKIYFNHRCFSGPYLSKGRISELPKCVGPGPVTLVMKEVLSMLINVAYKSSRVLRELQLDGDPDPSLHQQVLKAKYKGKSYRAVVELCKSSDQVADFCKNICIKLECCPYLFSPTFINGQCPENCSQQSKTKYTTYVGKKKKRVGRPPGGHSNLEGGPKKPGKRRKRKRLGFFKGKKSLSNPDSIAKDEEMDELDLVLQEESSNSTTASMELIASNGIHRRKRKYTKHVAPPLEMKTRGVKLPRYSIERRTRQPRLQLDTSIKMEPNDGVATFHELHLQETGRRSAFVPVKKEEGIVLDTNPLLWSVGEVVKYIKTTDCAPLARLFKEEEIDGQALLLLTLPTVQELMEVKLGPAIKLCHLIEKLKIAFYEQYAA